MPAADAPTKQQSISVVPSLPVWAAGLLGILLSIGATGTLVYNQLFNVPLPGCGEGSACAEATSGYWGKIPGTTFPVSIAGFAWFVAVGAAWLMARKGVPAQLKLLIRVGVLGSLFYIAVMVATGSLCYWCLAAHVGNLLLWACAEFGTRAVMLGAARSVGTVAGIFLLSAAGLGLVNFQQQQQRLAQAQAEQDESIAQMTANAAQRREQTEQAANADANDNTQDRTQPGNIAQNNPDQPAGIDPETPAAAPVAETNQADDAHPWGPRGFTGKYLYGPERAPIRIVMFSSYQCEKCKELEQQIKTLVDTRDDVSLSAKHFPMCTDCNKYVSRNMHPNACWGARAAEAAGMLYGNDGFWKMHFWLFEQGGSFTEPQIQAACQSMGMDYSQIKRLMLSETTLEPIYKDLDEAMQLGLVQTPLIYINGVELRGWHLRNAIPRAVQQVAAADPPPGTGLHDFPPRAKQKLIDDWLVNPLRPQRPTTNPRILGNEDAPVRILFYADLSLDRARPLDAQIRALVAQNPDYRYEFRTFPFSPACNPMARESRLATEHGCRVAKLVLAAASLDTGDPYWKFHDWLASHNNDFNDAAVRAAATSAGYDADALLTSVNDPAIMRQLNQEVSFGRASAPRQFMTLLVNDRVLARWTHRDNNFLVDVLEEAKRRAAE